MLRYLLFVFTLFYLNTQLAAQDYQINWGPENRKEGGLLANFRLVGLTDNSYHLIMRPRRSNTLVSFNLDHRLVDNRSINFQFGRKDLQLNDFIQTRSGNYAYFVDYDKREDRLSLIVSSFDNETFSDTREVFQQSFKTRWNVRYFGAGSYSAFGDISNTLSVSIDSSKVALANILSARERNDPEAYALAVFDENFELLWQKIQVFQYPDQDLKVIQSVVSNDGTIYLLGQLLNRRPALFTPAAERGLPRYTYKVFQVTEDGHKTFDVELEPGTAPQYAGLYFPDPTSSNFIVGGLYTTNERNSGLKGLFLNTVNVASGNVESTTYPLEQEFLEGLISNRALRKERGLNNEFRIKDFLQFDDGSFGFIAEEFYVVVNRFPEGDGAFRQSEVYHTNQIVIPRFSLEGELLNIQKIDKTFRSENAGVTSYAMALANGKVYLVYNDYKKASERRELREKGRDGGRYTDMTVIDENGEISFQETLFSSREIDMVYLPHQSDFSSTHLLLLAVKGKYYKCGLINLE